MLNNAVKRIRFIYLIAVTVAKVTHPEFRKHTDIPLTYTNFTDFLSAPEMSLNRVSSRPRYRGVC